jgi:hypothetical protein
VLDLGKDLVVVGVCKPRLPVLVAGLVLVLAGCSGEDPEPKMAPTQSVASTPSTSAPTVSPSTAPAEADFIAKFFGEISSAISNGDPSGFLAMTSGQCENCEVIASNLVAAYEDGGHIEGGLWTVKSTSFDRETVIGSIWNADVETARERWFDGNDDPIKIVRADTVKVAIALEATATGWRIREIRLL